MTRKKITIYTAVLGIVLLLVNFLAMKGSLYYIFWWFDMPMHIIGGFWSGLIIVLIFFKRFKNKGLTNNKRSIIFFLAGIFFIGILWELYEYFIELFIRFDIANLVDSISDLFFDLAGGVILIIGLKNKI